MIFFFTVSLILKNSLYLGFKYLQMKIKKINNLIGEEIMKNSLNINKGNTTTLIRSNKNDNIQKITNLNLDGMKHF